MSRDALWERVHAHLDAGQDPLDDDALVDALARDGDALAAVLRLRDRLGALPARPARRTAARLVPWAAAAALVALALLCRPRPDGGAPGAPGRRVDPTGRVVAFRVAVAEDSPLGRTETVVEARDGQPVATRRTTVFEWTAPSRPTAGAPGVAAFTARVLEP